MKRLVAFWHRTGGMDGPLGIPVGLVAFLVGGTATCLFLRFIFAPAVVGIGQALDTAARAWFW